MKRNKIKERIEELIVNIIDYDNEHHCFKWFTLGFVVCTLFVQIIILLKSSN